MPFETILAKEPPASGGFTWGLWRAKDVESWGSRIAVSAEYPIFRNMKHGLTIKEKVGDPHVRSPGNHVDGSPAAWHSAGEARTLMAALRVAATKSLAVLALLALLIGVYYFAIRPGQLRWGATPEELAQPLPGDDLVAAPSLRATRAVTIAGRPEDIWPWIVQIGYDRAGFYGYDLIENLGSKRGIRSAAKIVPELRRLSVGDKVYMSRIAYLVIHSMTANRFLVWVGDEYPPTGGFTFGLFPVDEKHTRLVIRARLRYRWTDSRILLDLFTEFGDHVAVPRMLLGVRDRVEGLRIQPLAVQAVEIAVWIALLLEFVVAIVLMLVRRQWWCAWIAAVLAVSTLLFALYARQPIWSGALLQVPILASMVWAWGADQREAA